MSHRGRRFGGFQEEKHQLTRPTRKVLGALGIFLGNHRLGLFFSVVLIGLSSIASVISPILLKDGIDLATEDSNYQVALWFMWVFLGLTLFSWILSSINTRVQAKISSRMLFEVREKIFDSLVHADIDYLKNEQSGNVTARITSDTEEVGTGLGIIISSGIQVLLLVSSFVIIVTQVHWLVALIALVSVPVALVLSAILAYFGKRIIINIRRAFGVVSGKMAENLAGVTISKSFNREDELAEELKKLNQEHYNYNKKFGLLMQLMMPTINAVSLITLGVILIVGGILNADGVLTIGEIYLGAVLAQRFLMPVIHLSMSWPSFQSSLGAMDRILDVLEIEPKVTDALDAKKLQTEDDAIHFENVSFAYNKGVWVLEDINLSVNSGELIAVVGETGAGKTTLCTALLPRFYDVQKGSIRIGDDDIKDVELYSLRKSIGMILQEPYLFTATVMDNIRYGAPEASNEDIRDLCKLIGADEFIEALPKGYDTIVREGGKKLSAGQRQMITIARMMLANPRILVLDEATSRLDAYSESLVQRAQELLFKGRTTFVIAHRLSTIRNADRIAVIDKGKLVELGTHSELLAKRGYYAELYHTYYSFQGFEKVELSQEEWSKIEQQEREEMKRLAMMQEQMKKGKGQGKGMMKGQPTPHGAHGSTGSAHGSQKLVHPKQDMADLSPEQKKKMMEKMKLKKGKVRKE